MSLSDEYLHYALSDINFERDDCRDMVAVMLPIFLDKEIGEAYIAHLNECVLGRRKTQYRNADEYGSNLKNTNNDAFRRHIKNAALKTAGYVCSNRELIPGIRRQQKREIFSNKNLFAVFSWLGILTLNILYFFGVINSASFERLLEIWNHLKPY